MRSGRIGTVIMMATLAAALALIGSATPAQVIRGSITNNDVMQMVKLGIPDGAIIAAIHVGPVRFNVSPDALLALHAAGVSQEVLRVMIETARAGNSVGGPAGIGGPLATQRGTPAGKPSSGTQTGKMTPQQLSRLFAKVHNSPGKASPMVTNPAATAANTKTLNLLQQQKQVALTERNIGAAQPTPSFRSVTKSANATAVQSKPDGTFAIQGPSKGSPSTSPAQRSGIAIAPPAIQGTIGTPAAPLPSSTPARTIRIATAPPAIQGTVGTAAAAPPSSGTNRAVITTVQTTVAHVCNISGPPTIVTVSGQDGPAIFTQDPQYNPFTIRGCSFGNTKGQAQLNSANGRKLADLTIDTWTDTLITVEVDPTLVGALDQSNVTLVLFPASGPQVQRSGFTFYAERALRHLDSIPAGEVTLATINDDGGSPVMARFSSPYATQQGSVSGGVDRFNVVRFPGGTDVFDFSRLKPGFVVGKFQVTKLSVAGTTGQCGFVIEQETDYTDGTWGWQLTGHAISVSWQEAHAHIPCQDTSNASYGLDVWVEGPVLGPNDSPWQ